MRFGFNGGVVAFAVLVLCNCRPQAPVQSVRAVVPVAKATPPAPPQGAPFVPPLAEPNRKGKLLALVPKLDALSPPA
jgi:hypothetical protein